ncbi:hypothetical protein [Leptospira sp. GIMC2001]|uniref:hypothetical protein n=1 Tax=Leptospira sp. GIMC2001 TaxID=1513297 RepID=UPI00234BF523|nr:hypothetical protein [Leptospira sp. GIMC2001]WCL51465.1 hypothetical protein O4O04_20325 [Leptospira sp. GIMC2001]
MRKKLLIGVSSPVGYYYELEKIKGRPGPILETPLSYFLLYDEIWFFSRRICPYNMENLKFVHFIDEELEPKGLSLDAIPKDEQKELGRFPFEDWNKIIVSTLGNDWRYDNHSRSFKFGEFNILPTPGNFQNLLIDRYIASKHGMTLVENSANSLWSREFNESHLQMKISERLINASTTSIQTLEGPWHPSIEELRNDNLLKLYRNKIDNQLSVEDITNLDNKIQELSNEFDSIVNRIVRDKFNKISVGKSAALYFLGLIPTAGNFIGGFGLLKETVDLIQARNNEGWTGFLGQAKKMVNNL